MKISVVIPAHNEALFIKKTLTYVLAQDFPEPFEVIVVDNASTDNTFEIASAFSGVRVLWESKKGVQWARERGRQEAKGEILAYLDADSLPPPNWLSKGMTYFADADVVAVAGIYNHYDASLFFRILSWAVQVFYYSIVHFFLHTLLHKAGVMIGGNFFVRSSAMEEIGGFDTSIVFYGDDLDTARRLTSIGRIRYTPRIHVQSSARRFKKENMFKLFFIYHINFIWILIFHRPYSQ